MGSTPQHQTGVVVMWRGQKGVFPTGPPLALMVVRINPNMYRLTYVFFTGAERAYGNARDAMRGDVRDADFPQYK